MIIQEIQDSYQEIQESRKLFRKSRDNFPDFVGIFGMQSKIFQDFSGFYRMFQDHSESVRVPGWLQTTLLPFDIPISMCKHQSWFRVNQRWISAAKPWKPNVSRAKKISAEQLWFKGWFFLIQLQTFQFWTALIQSWFFLIQHWTFQFWTALIHSWFFLIQRWVFQFWTAFVVSEKIRADHLLWISWKTSKLWNSPVQRCLSVGHQPGLLLKVLNLQKFLLFCGIFRM